MASHRGYPSGGGRVRVGGGGRAVLRGVRSHVERPIHAGGVGEHGDERGSIRGPVHPRGAADADAAEATGAQVLPRAPRRALVSAEQPRRSRQFQPAARALARPGEESWTPVPMAHGSDSPAFEWSEARTLESVTAFRDFLVLEGREGGFSAVWILELVPLDAGGDYKGARRLANGTRPSGRTPTVACTRPWRPLRCRAWAPIRCSRRTRYFCRTRR